MANTTTQFGGFLTNVGVAQQANTAALGQPWNITHMLIGDAGGEPSQTAEPTPKPTQSALVRQVYRAPLNALYPSPADPGVLVAELVLPPETGGWWIRELGLEDGSGNLIAVAKPAPSYKPLLVQGSGRTQTIRMHVVFGNVANVTLKIDPSIVLATRDYVDKAREATELYARNLLKTHLEAGDPHPQYLRRADAAKDDGPLAWLGEAKGTADALVLQFASTETVLKAYMAGQRFQFKATETNNAAVTVSINGLPPLAVRKVAREGLVDLVQGDIRAGGVYALNHDGSAFQLSVGVAADHAFQRYSFETSVGQTVFELPHSVGSTVVLRNGREITDYLSDGHSITFLAPCGFGESVQILAFGTFRSADAYTKAETQALLATASALPVGTMLPFPRGTVPAGFLEVDGSVQSASVYPDLAAYLGTAFNKGDEPGGFFRLPDSRGEFLRGWDHGRGVDPGRTLGSSQDDAFRAHAHKDVGFIDNVGAGSGISGVTGATGTVSTLYGKGYGNSTSSTAKAYQETSPGSLEGSILGLTSGSTGGAETRPRNLAVMWCIKAWNVPVNQGTLDVASLAALTAQATEVTNGTARLASQSEVDSGVVDNAIVTPKKMRWGFSAQFGTNGYMVFPTWLGGLILQYGSSATTTESAEVRFPIAFPNRCFWVGAYDNTPPGGTIRAFWQFRGLNTAGMNVLNMGTFTRGSSGWGGPTLSACPYFAIGF